jgi:hypothetical protein
MDLTGSSPRFSPANQEGRVTKEMILTQLGTMLNKDFKLVE